MTWSRLLLVLAAFVAVSCGRRQPREFESPPPSFQSKAAARANDLFRRDVDYIRNACFGGVDEGGPGSPASSRLETVHFGKRFDGGRFRSVLAASPRATVGRIESEGAAVFHVPLQAGECAIFSALREVPDDLWPNWSIANVTVGGSLLALYLPVDRVRPSGYDRPVIMIRADSDRYTLVHEYLHFNFDQVRVREGRSDPDILRRLELRAAKLRTALAEDASAPGRGERVATAWVEVAETLIPLLDSFPLEEIAIEAKLGSLHRRGELKYVSDYSRDNGDRYLRANWLRARPYLDQIVDDAGTVKAELRAEDSLLRSRIESVVAQAKSRLKEGEKLADEATGGALRGMSLFRLDAEEPPAGECGHSTLDWNRIDFPDL